MVTLRSFYTQDKRLGGPRTGVEVAARRYVG
jgi:hypothetical protein